MKKLMAATTLLATLFLTACPRSQVDSEFTLTGGIRPEITVKDYGSGSANVGAKFFTGSGGVSGTVIDLNSGDHVDVYVDDVFEIKLSEQRHSNNNVDYRGSLSGDLSAAQIRVALIRPENDNAPNSSVIMPEAFDFDQTTSSTLNAGDTMVLDWSPAYPGEPGRTIQISYELTCDINNVTHSYLIKDPPPTPDDGNYQTDISNLVTDVGDGCTLTVTMRRRNFGNTDPNYHGGGYIRADQIRSVQIEVLP